jgi:hypothetical protein
MVRITFSGEFNSPGGLLFAARVCTVRQRAVTAGLCCECCSPERAMEWLQEVPVRAPAGSLSPVRSS